MTKQFLGQHFLQDRAAVRTIIRAIEPARGDTIVEIGAGHGELTLPLAEACAERGGAIIAIEKDRMLAAQLEEKLRGARRTEVRVITGDALEVLRREFHKGGRLKIAGNIPYYLTGRLLRLLGEEEFPAARCVFTVQREVAERLVAQPPRMNRLAASVQFWGEPQIVAFIPKERFRPAPKVDSAIVAIDAARSAHGGAPEGAPKKGGAAISPPSAAAYYATMRALFSQPRKTVLNNLTAHCVGKKKEEAAALLRAAGVPPAARPQDLAVRDIAKIAAAANAFVIQ